MLKIKLFRNIFYVLLAAGLILSNGYFFGTLIDGLYLDNVTLADYSNGNVFQTLSVWLLHNLPYFAGWGLGLWLALTVIKSLLRYRGFLVKVSWLKWAVD